MTPTTFEPISERRRRVRSPAHQLGEPPVDPGVGVGIEHDRRPSAAQELRLDQRVLEAHRSASELLDNPHGAGGVTLKQAASGMIVASRTTLRTARRNVDVEHNTVGARSSIAAGDSDLAQLGDGRLRPREGFEAGLEAPSQPLECELVVGLPRIDLGGQLLPQHGGRAAQPCEIIGSRRIDLGAEEAFRVGDRLRDAVVQSLAERT